MSEINSCLTYLLIVCFTINLILYFCCCNETTRIIPCDLKSICNRSTISSQSKISRSKIGHSNQGSWVKRTRIILSNWCAQSRRSIIDTAIFLKTFYGYNPFRRVLHVYNPDSNILIVCLLNIQSSTIKGFKQQSFWTHCKTPYPGEPGSAHQHTGNSLGYFNILNKREIMIKNSLPAIFYDCCFFPYFRVFRRLIKNIRVNKSPTTNIVQIFYWTRWDKLYSHISNNITLPNR